MAQPSEGNNSTLSPPWQCWWGAIGAVSPYAVTAIRAVGLRTDFPLPHFGWGFVGVILLLLALGAVWSRALESHHKWLALYHGATVPVALQFLFGGSKLPGL